MGSAMILDCTLRDGGYCNQWTFGEENISKIIVELLHADVDVIECGFLTERTKHIPDISKFNSMEELKEFIPRDKQGKIFVAMANFGEFDLKGMPTYDGRTLDGIRLAFHKKDLDKALQEAKIVQEKGYKLFLQAMVSLNYTDEEFINLLKEANKLEPYAFYIVDSFGAMRRKDLIRLFYLVEHNLKSGIKIGFHGHNNLQLAYSNAQSLLEIPTSRDLLIDSSIYGMGRGAGNLNTELLISYLNNHRGTKYFLPPILSVIDEILVDFHERHPWGFTLAYYISAIHNAHPNYASYLDDKKTLTVEMMNEIFGHMEPARKSKYDADYIELIYSEYMERGSVYEAHLDELKKALNGKTVLLIGPGKSTIEAKKQIQDFGQREDSSIISVNFNYNDAMVDYIFCSNMRRFRKLNSKDLKKCIVTSNIKAEGVYLQVKYRDLMNNFKMVKDNAGLMAMKLLASMGVKQIELAGFDGYSHDMLENYADEKMSIYMKNQVMDEINEGMKKAIEQYRKDVDIEFISGGGRFGK